MEEIYEKYSKDIKSSKAAPSTTSWFSSFFTKAPADTKSTIGKLDLESDGNKSETSSLINGVKQGFFSKASDVSA